MQLFSPDRPEASPGTKALLLDGSAVPSITLAPEGDDTFGVIVNLRNYAASGRSYSQRSITLSGSVLLTFLKDFVNDPEATLEQYYDWMPQATEQMRQRPATQISPAMRQAMDLL